MRGLWLYLHFPQLQLDSLLAQQMQSDEAQSQETIVIVDAVKLKIVQLSPAAAQAGIHIGMNLSGAAALCQSLQVLSYEPSIEQDQLTMIANQLYSMTSDICFFADSGLLLRVHTMLNLYQGLEHYWLALSHQLTPLKVSYDYATAHTPLAARLLALQGWNTITDDSQRIQHQLHASPLRFTELHHKQLQQLQRVGIEQLGALQRIPLTDIAQRFDHALAEYLGRVTGSVAHPVRFYHPEMQFSHTLELLYEISDTTRLAKPLQHLLQRMAQHLVLCDKLTNQITLTLHQRDTQPIVLTIGSQQGEYRAEVWLRLVQLQLEQLVLSAPVISLSLCADKAYLRQPDNADLFSLKQGEISRLQLVSILQAKLGEAAISTPQLVNDHRPECASRLVNVFTHNTQTVAAYPMRPLFLLAQPTPLNQKVSILHGPERIQTGWWDAHSIARDYFIARTAQGQWYWVYRTPQQQWYLHGVFS